ncbi:MAG: hypothetical protein HKN03_11980 [Acidimicrobiales bacterium]|nr:hypothetical protein [Acidimicrobiales bacterium]
MSTRFATPLRKRDSGPNRSGPPENGGGGPPVPARPMWIWLAAAAVAGIATIGLVVAVWANDDSSGSAEPLALSAGDGGATASCLPFSVETLAGMAQAFEGTVTAVTGNTITIAVDRWYTGSDASTVELTTIGDAQALLGGPSYTVGSQYLISASDGAVNYCGYSDAATPELRDSFAAAFGG